MGEILGGEAVVDEVRRILEEARERVAQIVARERQGEFVSGKLMDMRMRGWSTEGTFAWLVERSNALSAIEKALDA